jgi:hypothetical protein
VNAPPRAKSPGPPPSAGRAFLRLLWRSPLLALPFGLFFGVLMGHRFSDYVLIYKLALLFAYFNATALWATRYFLVPALEARGIIRAPSSQRALTTIFASATLVSSALAVFPANYFLVPGFLGDARAMLMLLMFTLLFLVMVTGINLAIYYYRQALQRAQAEQELVLARRIQGSFLITEFPEIPRLEIHAVNLPSKEVSGDFYDVVATGDGAWLLAIADVSGKGVPAALLTSMLQASLRTQAGITDSVAAILGNMNRLAYRSTHVHQFATFFLARIETEPLLLRYSNAGHNHPVLQRAGGRRDLLDRGGVVVGILEDAKFEEARVSLGSGDRIIFYTDGVSEAENAAGEMFGEERLHRLISELPANLSAREIVDRVVEAVRRHLNGAEAGDDITLLVMRVR